MSNMFDIFNQDAFKVSTLTLAMREIKYVPSFVSGLGLFNTQSIDTTDVAIEKDAEQNLFIVPSSPRGGPGKTFGKNRRTMRKLVVPHFQVDDAIYADEVQSVRAFGDAYATETFQARIAQRAAEVSQSFALTEEYHRLSVITKGQLLDADGSVMYDYATEFGETMPAEIDFDLDNANPAEGAFRKKVSAMVRSLAESLGGLPYTGILAICGDNFWDDLVTQPEITKTYYNWLAAQELRSGLINQVSGQTNHYGAMSYADVMWYNYRGGAGVGIETDKCYFIPLGVPGLFQTVYAPADYIETVNRPGQRLYAKLWKMPNDKGMNREIQSNVLHYCSRPRVLIRGKRT